MTASPTPQLAATFQGSLTAEQELLLLLVRDAEGLHGAERARVLAESADWKGLYRLAQRHRVEPLVYKKLSAHLADEVEPKVLARFKQHLHASIRNHILLNEALGRVLFGFNEAGIPIIPFKGPVLSHLLYNQIGVRIFSDVDVLIHRTHFESAKKALIEIGFKPAWQESPEEEARRLATQMGFEFFHPEMNAVIEVHWQFLHSIHAFDVSLEAVWDRSAPMVHYGEQMRRLSHEDHLVYLCAHGCKHYWENLNWICDIAHFLKSKNAPVDWDLVTQIAAEAKGERMLYLGLNLANSFFGAPLPANLNSAIARDEAAQRLTKQVMDWVFTSVPKARLDAQHRRFHLEMRERVMDRIPYYWHLAKLAVQPTENDLEFVELPRKLGFLYYAIRPVRLLRDWVAGESEKQTHMRV